MRMQYSVLRRAGGRCDLWRRLGRPGDMDPEVNWEIIEFMYMYICPFDSVSHSPYLVPGIPFLKPLTFITYRRLCFLLADTAIGSLTHHIRLLRAYLAFLSRPS